MRNYLFHFCKMHVCAEYLCHLLGGSPLIPGRPSTHANTQTPGWFLRAVQKETCRYWSISLEGLISTITPHTRVWFPWPLNLSWQAVSRAGALTVWVGSVYTETWFLLRSEPEKRRTVAVWVHLHSQQQRANCLKAGGLRFLGCTPLIFPLRLPLSISSPRRKLLHKFFSFHWAHSQDGVCI